MNHIVNGDVVGGKIKTLNDNIVVWREMYDFGPLSQDWTLEETYKRRAEFFEQKLQIPSSFFIENCRSQYQLLNELSRSEEVVLWFEHDRYDQVTILYLLSELSALGFQKISMVSINEYEGIEPFYGLGQLSSEQLIGLLPTKQEVTDKQIEEACAGWIAYCSNNLTELNEFILKCHALPFLNQALLSHLTYFPSQQNGLNEVEFLALSMINEGITSFAELFNKLVKQRTNDGLSDLYFATILNELLKCDYPLISSDSELPSYKQHNPKAKIELTKWGLDVLTGKANRMNLIGIDWWVGGVHLIEKPSNNRM
ncbi:DUF1835 domain-containing protein [Bacillus sp. AFS053548]|uniref:DUF1835 domain-containing protein n=1 Tax=Bacillus sp. AFS053548 TaxID=2033505 RepID=UPI000BFDF611|nr:DUF1835 domain-containing protein [Bacillus sp. AFS053548]PGM48697.1 hypothetical protein CN946_23045 [Bacillus sp. AFS053548]